MSKEKTKFLNSINCRMVGPGGTNVAFYATREGVKCVWTNENCPYEDDDDKVDQETDAALDGHNVSMLSWNELEEMLKSKPKTNK